MILEISEHGSYLGREHESFVVKTKEKKQEFPAVKIDGIVISCNASVSTSAISLCLENGIQLVLTDWAGRPLGRFWHASQGKNTETRRRQYLAADKELGRAIAQRILQIKLKEQRKLLLDLKNNRETRPEELETAIIEIGKAASKTSSASKIEKQALLGIEGNSANLYFSAIKSILPEKYKFNERNQHPAKDPFNALLNYGYGIAYRDLETPIIVSGLDPNAGFYHVDQYGKPTLTFDLIELFRPKIDRLAISLISKKKVKDDWFEQNDGQCSLSLKGRKVVIQEYYDKIHAELSKETWAFCRWITTELIADGAV